ncbi:proprotein convertase subtilisin/kexin type 4-like isoform X1 [Tachypleus tridentatus]|uniref:proprotein convertase subtilisin/kexin type 4-like isoform X1 n=2 Tax=Tachypleus tridentatus TaxID=6853 RepID=UPI003FD1D7E6
MLNINCTELHFVVCLITVLITVKLLEAKDIYTDQFVIRVEGGPTVAKELANKHGFIYLGEIVDDYYHLKHHQVSKRSLAPSLHHHAPLHSEKQVKWLSQQKLKRRMKRDLLSFVNSDPDVYLNDPKWKEMWYLNRGNGLDMNVKPAWDMKVSGKGIVVTILDDGLEKDHPDIKKNYDRKASFDVNNNDEDPQPRYDLINSNRHGTRCAGEVAAVANNSICSVGIAFDAGIGGVRMLDGDVTDAVEARSLSLNTQHIDIYSASWGPDDDGKTVDGPGKLATKAFIRGIEKGRAGLGSIFVWASGNGGRNHDNCNCDGYTNSIWTLSISSATENGLVPWYSEACSSTLATTYSSGSGGERQIITSDLHHSCTSQHTGTSASAPLAAGICALALEANNHLTWRDMQHIVVRTARMANLHSTDWKTNGVGRNVSHSFGYGLMDAAAMVKLSRKWKTVPQQKVCTVRAHPMDKMISPKSYIEVYLKIHCENVKYLEHVQAQITLSSTRRGDIHIYLQSPMGTKSTLLERRPLDTYRSGFVNWPFLTVHNWGENPNGEWKLEIHNEGRFFGRATLTNWTMILYGTTEDPQPLQRMSYDPFMSSTPAYRNSVSTVTSIETRTLLSSAISTVVRDKDLTSGINYSINSLGYNASAFPGTSQLIFKHTDGSSVDAKQEIESVEIRKGGHVSTCPETYYLLNEECVEQCPDGYYPDEQDPLVVTHGETIRLCVTCHYTCKTCNGPNDYQCTSCHKDADLNEKYCSHRLELLQLRESEHWYTTVTVAFVVLCIITLILAAILIAERARSPCSCLTKETKYSELPVENSNHVDIKNSISAVPYHDEDKNGRPSVKPYYDSEDLSP